jgi:hypothetical protein
MAAPFVVALMKAPGALPGASLSYSSRACGEAGGRGVSC